MPVRTGNGWAGLGKSEIARRLPIGRTSVRRILATDSSQE
jgi:DNA-binding transcriptional regulator LsrR (DeoR family)